VRVAAICAVDTSTSCIKPVVPVKCQRIVHGVHGGDPRASRRAPTSDGAARAGRPISQLVLRTTLGIAPAGIFPFAAIMLLGPKLLPLVLGPSWVGASQTVSLLAVASYLWFVVAPAETVALIVEASKREGTSCYGTR
jgi:hypothetical protein